MLLQEFRYGRVDIILGMECTVAHWSKYPGVDYPDGIFDDGLVPESVRLGGKYCRFVVLGKVGKVIVDLWLVAAALGDCRPEIVSD